MRLGDTHRLRLGPRDLPSGLLCTPGYGQGTRRRTPDSIAAVSRRPLINRAPTAPLIVLRYVRRDSQIGALADDIEGVIAFDDEAGGPITSSLLDAIL